MIRATAMTSLMVIAMAGGLAACDTMGGSDNSAAPTGSHGNTSTTSPSGTSSSSGAAGDSGNSSSTDSGTYP